jgi:hypothetical protein
MLKHEECKLQVSTVLNIRGLRGVRMFSLVVMCMLRTGVASVSQKVTITYQNVRCHNTQHYGSHKYEDSFMINEEKENRNSSE